MTDRAAQRHSSRPSIHTVATLLTLCLAVVLVGVPRAFTAEREILVASVMDLSGPLREESNAMRNGMTLRFEEENNFGGIGGRRLRLLVEDAGANAESARAAAQKLAREHPLAVVGNLGPEAIAAAAPVFARQQTPDLFAATPLALERALPNARFRLHAEPGRLTRTVIEYVIRLNGQRKPAIVHADDAYGREIRAGFDEALNILKLKACERQAYAPGGLEAALERVHGSRCDLVVLGALPDDTARGARTLRTGDWPPALIAAPIAYGNQMLGKAVEGLYAAAPTPLPASADTDSAAARWAERYRARFKSPPGAYGVVGYVAADLFITAAHKAGPRLDAATLASALGESSADADQFGHPAFQLAADNRAGLSAARLAQVRGGRWVLVTDLLR